MLGLRILLVDDSPVYRRTAARYLRARAGVAAVEEAASGPEALAALERRSFDVVLLDFGMPQMTGFDVARRIKACRPAPRVVIVTIHDADSLRPAALEAGADAVVPKWEVGPDLVEQLQTLCRPGPEPPGPDRTPPSEPGKENT